MQHMVLPRLDPSYGGWGGVYLPSVSHTAPAAEHTSKAFVSTSRGAFLKQVTLAGVFWMEELHAGSPLSRQAHEPELMLLLLGQ